MAASLAALAVCVLAVGIASGVVVSLMLVSAGLVSEFIASISQVTSVRFTGAIIGGCTLLVLSLAVWGEREAPTHAIASIGARRANESEYPALFAVVDGVCRQADAPRTTIYLVPSDSPLSLTEEPAPVPPSSSESHSSPGAISFRSVASRFGTGGWTFSWRCTGSNS
ncbi:hypothetical protein C455_08527 [Haloferax larsenii JCM 13917]|nr:hypothetical protein C455_08527 [Haloferax larsenii JCM 13917]